VATRRRRRPSGGRSVSGNGHGTPLLATLSTDEESSCSSVADSRSVQRQHFIVAPGPLRDCRRQAARKGALKSRDLTSRDLTTRPHNARVDIARLVSEFE